jgi:long-subunit acyl-CoA synthetase (AMP-forming)
VLGLTGAAPIAKELLGTWLGFGVEISEAFGMTESHAVLAFTPPEETAATLIDGWLHTGDLGSFTDEGYLKIIGRKKEIIITAAGKNLSPNNIELSRVEQVKRWTVLGQEWTPDSGELTPSMKLKRTVIHDRYRDQIESMY